LSVIEELELADGDSIGLLAMDDGDDADDADGADEAAGEPAESLEPPQAASARGNAITAASAASLVVRVVVDIEVLLRGWCLFAGTGFPCW
jgi:hypothetical protein